MQSVAQGWLVYSLTKSPFYLGMTAAASTLPILLFTLIGGIAADRFRKRNLLIATQALSIVPALMLGIFTDIGVITVEQVIFFAFFLGTVNAFDMPARQSFVVEMVGKGHLLNAIALNSAAFNGARLIGPVIAGLAIAYMGLPSCFFLNAASFIPVIIALSMLKAKGEIRSAQKGFLKDLAEGFYFIKGRKNILYMMLLIAVFSLFGIPFTSFLPVFAEEIFNAGPTGLGLLVSATGLGALSAAIMLAFKSDMKDKLRFMSLSGLCFSLALLCASFSRLFAVSLLLLMMAGWGIVSFLATANSFIQLSTSDNLRGRVMSVYSFVFLGFTPIGNFLMGLMSERIGTTNTVAAASLVCLAGASIFAIKHMNDN